MVASSRIGTLALCIASSDSLPAEQLESSALLQRTRLAGSKIHAEMSSHGELDSAALTSTGTSASELRLLESLATSLVNTGAKIDDETKEALKNLLQTELNKSKEQIKEAHEADEAAVATMVTNYNNGCLKTFEDSQKAFQDSMNPVTGAGGQLRTAHKDCRDDLEEKDATQNLRCGELKVYNDGLRATGPAVLTVPSERGEMKDWWAALDNFLKGFEPWKEKETNCANAEEARAEQVITCRHKQTAYETGVCSQKQGGQSHCASYDECYQQSEENVDATSENAEAGEKARKFEWEAIIKIECYANLLLELEKPADQAGLQACKDLQVDLSHLDLDLTPMPGPKVCDLNIISTEYGGGPCTNDFTAQYIGMMDVEECQPCPGEKPPPSLILKVSKNDPTTMHYDWEGWTNDELLNEHSSRDSDESAKYPAFLTRSFSMVRICMGGPDTNCVEHQLQTEYSSAKELFSSGFVQDRNLDQDGIITAFGVPPGSYRTCPMNYPGFNVQCWEGNKARWGFCANCPTQECGDKGDADATIGIGLHGQGSGEQSSGWTGYFAGGADQCELQSHTSVSVWFYVLPGYTPTDILIMKVSKNGERHVLEYDSPLWENAESLNPESPADVDEHAKYPAFHSQAFQSIKMCMHGPANSAEGRCVVHTLGQQYSSARALFSGGFVSDANLDQTGIIESFGVPGGTYKVCPMQRPGFNVICRDRNKARWGFCANCPTNDCKSDDGDSDAVIGIGLHGQDWRHNRDEWDGRQSAGWTGFFAGGLGQCEPTSDTDVSVWFYVQV